MGMNTDPWPYIWSSYGIGFFTIYGIYLLILLQSNKLKKLEKISEKD